MKMKVETKILNMMTWTLFDVWLFGEDRNADIVLTYYYFCI